MNKILGIVLLGLCAGAISCSDKYVVVGIPTLKSLCKPVVEKDFYEKVDQLFTIVKKTEFNEADEQQLQELLEYNYKMQHDPYIQANIQLPSLLHLKSGKTPFQLAVKYDLDKVVLQLVAAGEDVHACDFNGRTALHVAAVNDSDKVILQLFYVGAFVNIKDNYGCTPLHYAVIKNREKATLQLLNVGAIVNIKDNNGNSILHAAVLTSAEKIVPQLLAHRAIINDKNNKGCSPLHYIDFKKNKDQEKKEKIIRQLLAHRATIVNAHDNDSKTPLNYVDSIYLRMSLLTASETQEKQAATKIQTAFRKYKGYTAPSSKFTNCCIS